jgi:hypothetical protein
MTAFSCGCPYLSSAVIESAIEELDDMRMKTAGRLAYTMPSRLSTLHEAFQAVESSDHAVFRREMLAYSQTS